MKKPSQLNCVFLLDFLNVCTNQIQQIPTLSWWDNRYYGVIIVNSNNLFSNLLSISFNTISVNWQQIRTNYEIIFFFYIINTLHINFHYCQCMGLDISCILSAETDSVRCNSVRNLLLKCATYMLYVITLLIVY